MHATRAPTHLSTFKPAWTLLTWNTVSVYVQCIPASCCAALQGSSRNWGPGVLPITSGWTIGMRHVHSPVAPGSLVEQAESGCFVVQQPTCGGGGGPSPAVAVWDVSQLGRFQAVPGRAPRAGLQVLIHAS